MNRERTISSEDPLQRNRSRRIKCTVTTIVVVTLLGMMLTSRYQYDDTDTTFGSKVYTETKQIAFGFPLVHYELRVERLHGIQDGLLPFSQTQFWVIPRTLPSDTVSHRWYFGALAINLVLFAIFAIWLVAKILLLPAIKVSVRSLCVATFVVAVLCADLGSRIARSKTNEIFSNSLSADSYVDSRFDAPHWLVQLTRSPNPLGMDVWKITKVSLATYSDSTGTTETADLELLEKYKDDLNSLRHVELHGFKSVDSARLLSILSRSQLAQLSILRLDGTAVNDEFFSADPPLDNLTELSLNETKITGKTIDFLIDHAPKLKVLSVADVDLDFQSITRLENARPGLLVAKQPAPRSQDDLDPFGDAP